MNIELLRDHCVSKNGVTEECPFGDDTLVFKVKGKMFCLISLSDPNFCNLKCAPEYAIELREKYAEVQPGYHMSKKHWNTVNFKGALTDKEILHWIDDSYNLVIAGLPVKLKQELLEK
ncbi:MmcQ/YjbR family DNA-binding protein [Solitalea koreensis]|uniref:Predicted DNA-binding protein, MmcQ/YjbR family n=1 Tax=Solitalea koreensis TaxID=543615 RepID=A0A521CF50_9SPHI|nr:MmcQ/YjbR family DNA-binding protein [Solitalea koreensis]SMO58067.1 Predicted DNA-binding protein, MmcQ/YjbR family [Solitalea koreensis]